MSDRLADKVSLITGAGSGIGRASALLFAAEGSRVAVADIDVAAAQETVRLITAAGGVAADYRVDVTDPDDGERLAESSSGSFGAIDVLFNNAGIAGIGCAPRDVGRAVGPGDGGQRARRLPVARAVLPHMIAAGRGSIINMSSTIAEIGLANRASYAASKGAVLVADPPDAGRLRQPRDPRQRAACPARSIRRSSTATSRRATTIRSPGSRRSRSGS